ncbi:hypothetical protein DL98DRAFT_541061 [Cadophora sp. DSE1049]|nr:hypothetical protein DL98DRAFT_541061 [Cadophora sp. DSE1049]
MPDTKQFLEHPSCEPFTNPDRQDWSFGDNVLPPNKKEITKDQGRDNPHKIKRRRIEAPTSTPWPSHSGFVPPGSRYIAFSSLPATNFLLPAAEQDRHVAISSATSTTPANKPNDDSIRKNTFQLVSQPVPIPTLNTDTRSSELPQAVLPEDEVKSKANHNLIDDIPSVAKQQPCAVDNRGIPSGS